MGLTRWLRRLGVAGAATLALAMSHAASGEVAEVRISHGYGVLYLPLIYGLLVLDRPGL
jgi:ABC-type nitrate/sulfonate/bicarbonate transport system substrate-binding protein